MIFDLSGFLHGENHVFNIEGELENKDVFNDLDGEFKIVGKVVYKGKIFKVDTEYLLKLNISYTVENKCDRCLQPTTNNIETTLEAKLEEYNKNFDDELDDIIFYDNGVLSLDEYIISQVMSSLPMKYICSEDCKGLCPKCGVNLNTESCDCIHDEIDPRLEKLKDFFKK